MLENQFFPTPQPVIEKMVAPYVKHVDVGRRKYTLLQFDGLLLEPSAGAGAILDYVCEAFDTSDIHRRVYAIELDLELRMILTEKGYKVVGGDFLDYKEPVEFGLILANPPFANGAAHALKIWSLLAPGGDAAILLNSETVNNPHSEVRKALCGLIELHGSTEEFGQCFRNAERPTDVSVTCVRLTKPRIQARIEFDADRFEQDHGISDEEFARNPLAHRDIIKNLVIQYDRAVEALKERQLAQAKLDFFMDGIDSAVYGSCNREAEKSLKQREPLIDQVQALKSRFWNTVFTKTQLSRVTTSQFHKKFDQFSLKQAAMAFSEANVHEVLSMFFENRDSIMTECLIDVWDKLCAYHADNKIHYEGWKTNKGWRLNKKVIHPHGIRHDGTYISPWSCRYGDESDIYTDLDKVLCYLDGRSFSDCIATVSAIRGACDRANRGYDYAEVFESTFFKIRIFKKGTVHLVFKDLQLLQEFNLRVAKHRNWLGNGS